MMITVLPAAPAACAIAGTVTDLIVTSYFTAKSDRSKALAPRDDISNIGPWYHSVASLGLTGVILRSVRRLLSHLQMIDRNSR